MHYIEKDRIEFHNSSSKGNKIKTLTVAGKFWLIGTRMSPGGTSSPKRATGWRGDMLADLVLIVECKNRVARVENMIATGYVKDGQLKSNGTKDDRCEGRCGRKRRQNLDGNTRRKL